MNNKHGSYKGMKSSPWNPDNYYLATMLAFGGMSDEAIAKNLGVTIHTLRKWKLEREGFGNCIDSARAARKRNSTLKDYFYNRLTHKNQAVWDEIYAADQENDPAKKTKVFIKQNKRTRQMMFLTALYHHNFNASAACRFVNIARQTYEQWVEYDSEFADLIHECEQVRKDFYQSSLDELVAEKNVLATIFANRTKNRDRGYGEKLEMEVSGSVNHRHTHLIIDKDLLNQLSVSAKRELLYIIEQKEEQENERLENAKSFD